MNTLRFSVISGIALLGVATAAPAIAVAETNATPAAITVAYTDLNPNSQQDAAELYSRLQNASKQVCAPYMISQVNQYAARKACYMRVLAKAVHDVREHEVTAIHARAVHGNQSTEQLAAGGSAGNSASK